MYKEMEKQIILSEYKFPTRPSSDGYFHVYVADPTKPSGRKQLKAKNLDNLKEKVYQYETGINGAARKTFKNTFEISQKEKLKYIKDPERKLSAQNSAVCLGYDYNRYFKDTAFENMFIDEITKKDIEDVSLMNLQRYDLAPKAFLSLRGIIKSTLNFAFENYWIDENPYMRVNFRRYDTMLVRPVPSGIRVHSEENLERMLEYIRKHQERRPAFIPAYALELQILAGLRRGEVPALMWSDISDTFIAISREQLTMRKGQGTDRGYCVIVNHTKTWLDRKFPITNDIRKLLAKLKEIDERYYPDSKYLFPSATTSNGVISNTAVYRFYSRMCHNLGIEINSAAKKGPHSFRRNGITKVANSSNGNLLMASSLYGNSPGTASKHYYTGVDYKLALDILEEGNQE